MDAYVKLKKNPPSANRFLAVYGQVRNLFGVGRYNKTAINSNQPRYLLACPGRISVLETV